jgi:small subunit ribosomal protein S1
VVLKFDRETERVSLGMKQLQADPWTTATIKYPVATRVKGRVVSLTDYGAFVELEQGVEGLIHVSEMSWSKKVKHPSKILAVNQEVECQVLGIDQEAHRISLGLKQVEANPWEQLAEKYPIGSKITGKVRNLTEFGAFVEVEEGIDGLIHISDLSWTKRIKHPSEVLKKGDTAEAVVLNIDADNQRLSLGLKQLSTDVWEDYLAHHKIGEIVEGKIVRVTTFGAFVELAEGIEGLVHVSELDEKRVENPEAQFNAGDTFPMKIVKVQEEDRKIGLSIKAVKADEVTKDIKSFKQASGSDRSTIGDILKAQLEAAAAKEEEE